MPGEEVIAAWMYLHSIEVYWPVRVERYGLSSHPSRDAPPVEAVEVLKHLLPAFVLVR